ELELDRINPPRFSVQIPTNIRREYNNRSTSPTRSSITSSSSSLSKHQSISPKLKSLSGNSEEISPHHVEQEINQNSQNSSIQHSDRIEENENFNYPKEQKREPDLVEGDISLQGEGEGEANVTEVNDDNELPESKIDLIAVETTPPSKLDETDLISVKLNEPKSKDEFMPTNEDIKNLNEDLTINTPNTSPKELELPIVSCNSNSQRTELINALGREIEQIEEDLDKWNHIYNKKKEKITKRVEKEREEREKCKKEKENLKEKCKEEQRVKRAAEDRALCVNHDENENKEIKVQIQKKRRKSKKKHVFRNNKRRALDQKSTKKIAEGISNINDTEESNIHSKRLEVKTNEEEIKKIYKDLFDGVGLVESRPALIKSFNLKKKEEDCKIEELKKQRENLRNKWNVSHKTNNNNEEKLKKDRYSRNQGTRKSGRFSKNDYVNSEAAVEEIAKQILKEAEQERRAAPVPPMIIGEKNRHYAKFINNNNIVRDPVSFYGFNKDPGEKWTPEEHVVFMRQFKFTPKSKKIEIYKELKKAYSLNKNGSKVKEEFGKSTNNRNTVVKQSPKKRKAPLIATESDHQQRTDNNLPERRNNMRENSVGNNCVEIYNKEDDLTENDQNQLVTEEIINKIEIEEQADDDYSLKSQSTSIPLISSIATMDPPLPTNNQNFQQNITDVEDAAHALTLLAQLPITENTQKSMQKGGKNKSKQYDHPTRARNLSIEENVPTKKKITSSYWNKSDVEKFNNSLNQYGTNFKKISEILETKSETQVKNYYEKHIASGVIPKTVESRSETLAHLETSPSISTTHTPQPVVQTSSDINTEQQTFNNNGNYFNNNRSDTQPQVEPPHKSVTSPSINYNRSSSPQSSVKSAISHLLNPSTDDNISHDWFNGDQSSDNPMVIDVDAEESRPPEIMSSVVNQPTPIQFIPVTQSTQPNQSLNQSHIPKYFMPTISNSQQSQNIPQHRQGWVEQNQFRQSNSLPQAYYSSNTPPPPPPHHSVQPQGPNNMAPNNINTNSLAPSNLSPNSMSPTTPASMYLPPTNPIYPYQYSSLIVPDSSSQNRSSGQLVTGSNTVNQHSPGRGTYPTTSTYLPRGGAPVFENYNNVSPNVPSIITSPTPPPLDNVQIRQSNYVVPQHQVD
ncbi:12838_t:CDS:2, partial [Dentiscutata erythropus]